jgi:hypothetical protein
MNNDQAFFHIDSNPTKCYRTLCNELLSLMDHVTDEVYQPGSQPICELPMQIKCKET